MSMPQQATTPNTQKPRRHNWIKLKASRGSRSNSIASDGIIPSKTLTILPPFKPLLTNSVFCQNSLSIREQGLQGGAVVPNPTSLPLSSILFHPCWPVLKPSSFPLIALSNPIITPSFLGCFGQQPSPSQNHPSPCGSPHRYSLETSPTPNWATFMGT